MEQVNKRVTLIFTVVTLILVGGLVIYAFFIAGSGGVKAQVQEGKLRVQAMMCDVTCGLDEIERVELRQDYDLGRRTNGFGNMRMKSGAFKNDELGSYHCATVTSSEWVILVHIRNDQPLVFNQATGEDTQAFYQQLQSALPAA